MSREDTIRLTVKSLLEVVQTGAKNIEIAVMSPGEEKMEMLNTEEIEKYVESINTEKAEEAATRRPGRTPGTGSLPTRGGAEGSDPTDE